MAKRVTLSEKVRSFWHKDAAIRTAPSDVVAAVSGGADSVALLHFVLETLPGRVVVAHVNHCLRGDESDGDEAFVIALAERLQSVFPGRVGIRTTRRELAQHSRRDGIEDAARRVRYDWLAEVAHSEGIGWIATGHTADDQAETILHNIIRGTGLRGLVGMSQRRLLAPEVELIRPMLDVTRAEVVSDLSARGQDFREDTSNTDRRFTRNRIRHNVLPLLKSMNPRIQEALCRLAGTAGDVRRLLDALAADLIRETELPRAGQRVVFDVKKLAGSRPYELRDMWRRIWEREGWPQRDLDHEHLDRLVAICRSESIAADLPGGLRARRRGPVVQVGPADAFGSRDGKPRA